MPTLTQGRMPVDGGNIMLFTYQTNGYKSIAHGTSHTLSLSTSTETINSKDYGKFGMTEAGTISWEITADHLYTRDGWNEFYNKLTAPTSTDLNANKVRVIFGERAEKSNINSYTVNNTDNGDGNWVPSTYTSYIYGGDAVITSLSWTADQGSKSTFSVTLSGASDIKRLSELNS